MLVRRVLSHHFDLTATVMATELLLEMRL
jgi:hypothetical protein